MPIESKDNRGAPLGNQNAVKGKLFYDKLRKVLTQQPERLDRVIERLISAAEAGEAWAIREVIDRIDGKAIQSVESLDGLPLPTGFQITFVNPT